MTLQPMLKNLSGWPLFALLFAFVLPLSTALTNILSAGILIWGGLHWRDCLATWREMKRQPVFIAMLAFLIVVLLGGLVALFNGINPADTLGKHRKFLLFFILLALFRDERTRLMAFVGFGLGEFLSLATSLYAAWSGHLFLNAVTGDYCTFRTHTYHNIFLVLGTFGLGTWLLTQPGKRATTWLGWLLVAMALYDILFLVRGRTGLLVLVLMAGLLLRGLDRRIRLAATAIAAAGLIGIALNESSTINIGITTILSDLINYQNGIRVTSTGYRIDFVIGTWEFIREAPILGHGTGSFEHTYTQFIADRRLLLSPTTNPHNEYLFFWGENGLAGLLSVIGLYGTVLYTGWHRAKWHIPRLYGLWISGLGLAYAVTSLGNSFLLDNSSGHIFITLLAALLASANSGKEKSPAQ